MKGGGIVIVLFLFICFVWGIASVVGGIRKAVGPRDTRQRPDLDKPAAAQPIKAAPASKPAEPAPDIHQVIASLRHSRELHESGAIGDAEFARLKAELLQHIHPRQSDAGEPA